MSVRHLYDRVYRVEDLRLGTRLRTASRTILESDIHQFCQLMGDMAGIHMSRLAAAEGRVGSVIAPGPMVLSLAIALTTGTGWFGPILDIFVGAEDWRAEKPTFPNDTIWAQMTVAAMRPTSQAGRHLLNLDVEVFATGAEVRPSGEEVRVCRFVMKFLVANHDIEFIPSRNGQTPEATSP
jgi:acyl dehydratase